MTNDVNPDELARKATKSSGAMEDLSKLFGATYALLKWIFIARGEKPNVNPYIASRADDENGQQTVRAHVHAFSRFSLPLKSVCSQLLNDYFSTARNE